MPSPSSKGGRASDAGIAVRRIGRVSRVGSNADTAEAEATVTPRDVEVASSVQGTGAKLGFEGRLDMVAIGSRSTRSNRKESATRGRSYEWQPPATAARSTHAAARHAHPTSTARKITRARRLTSYRLPVSSNTDRLRIEHH